MVKSIPPLIRGKGEATPTPTQHSPKWEKLPASEKALYLALSANSNPITLNDLARDAGISCRTVLQSIPNLAEKGVISYFPTEGGFRFKILIPFNELNNRKP